MLDRALLETGRRTAAAVERLLKTHCGDQAELGAVAPVPEQTNPFAMVPVPAVLSDVGYIGASTGGNIFGLPVAGARALAAAMMGRPAPEDGGDELDELEMSAIGEAMNQMMATAAATMAGLLGQEVDIDPPNTRVVASLDDALGNPPASAMVVSSSFTVCGHPARLVQVVPRSFLVRMGQALEEHAEHARAADRARGAADATVPAAALRDVKLRVWAEIGRTRMPMARAVGIRPGEVVELDRDAEDPVDLYVNGRRFATGTLLRVDDGDWAVRIESLDP
jgi:flagellar motor switch protein FliN/FliY